MSRRKKMVCYFFVCVRKKRVEQKQNSALYEYAESGATLRSKHYPPCNSTVNLFKEDKKEQ